MHKRGWRVVQIVGIVVLIGVLTHQILNNWDAVEAAPLRLTLRPGWVLAALGATWLVYLGLIEGWRRVSSEWSTALGWRQAARIWVISSLAALIPLRIWGYASMAVMSERAGVRSAAALGAAAVMQILSIGTGVAIAAVAVGRELQAGRPQLGLGLSLLGAAVLASLVVVRSRAVLALAWRVLRRPDAPPSPPGWPVLIEATLLNGLAWLGYGVSFWALGQGVLTDVDLSLRLAIGVYTVSYMAGYLAVITPGGLGVREGVMTALLTPSIGAPAAIALSIASRLAVTVAQAGAAVPFLFVKESEGDPT